MRLTRTVSNFAGPEPIQLFPFRVKFERFAQAFILDISLSQGMKEVIQEVNPLEILDQSSDAIAPSVDLGLGRNILGYFQPLQVDFANITGLALL